MNYKEATSIKDHMVRFLEDHELTMFSVTVASLCLISYLLAVYLPALIVGILLAYLLDALIARLCNWGCPRMFAIAGTMIISLMLIALSLLAGIPKMAEQLGLFARQLPAALENLEKTLHTQLDRMPAWVGEYWSVEGLFTELSEWSKGAAEAVLSSTLANFTNVFVILVYMILIPLMVFFMLRDKKVIFAWIGKFIPVSSMLRSLRSELDEQFGAYVRGKIIEGMTIFVVSLVGFLLLEVNYAFTLAVAIGLSVIIPFVGAVVVTIPVVIVGLLQFGFGPEFWWMIGFYSAVQIFDAQILVPILFSEIVKIHPVAILIAILLFGSLWGIWGVFFAIPLASLIKSIVNVVEKQLNAVP